MVEYGMILTSSVGSFFHRLAYDPAMWTPAILVIAAAILVVYGICKM